MLATALLYQNRSRILLASDLDTFSGSRTALCDGASPGCRVATATRLLITELVL